MVELNRNKEESFWKLLFYFILILIIYYIFITPISLILKIVGKSFLKLEFSNQKSYWKSKKQKKNYKRLY